MFFWQQKDGIGQQRRQQTLLDIGYFAVLALLCLLGVTVLVRYLLPFVLAFASAALLQRPLRWLVQRVGGRQRYFSVVLVILLVGTLAVSAVLLGGWLLQLCLRFFGNAQNLETVRQLLSQTAQALSEDLDGWTSRLSQDSRVFLSSMLQRAEMRLYDMAGDLFANAAEFLLSLITAWLPSFLIGFLTWMVATVFFTTDYSKIKSFLLQKAPDRLQRLLCRTGQLCGRSLGRLLSAYLLLMIITFVLLAAGLWLLRVPNALWIALLIAFIDLLPVLGTGTVLIPWALLSFATGQAALGGGLLALFGIILVVHNIVEPRLVGKRIGLHPLAALAAMYLGLQIAGLWGLLLFPPALTVLWCLKGDPCLQKDE